MKLGRFVKLKRCYRTAGIGWVNNAIQKNVVFKVINYDTDNSVHMCTDNMTKHYQAPLRALEPVRLYSEEV